MKITTKIFLKLFLLYFILYGSAMVLIEYFFDEEINLLKQLIKSIVFSGIMSAVYVNGRIHTVIKKRNDPITEEDFNISYCESIETKASILDILNKLKDKSLGKDFKIDSQKSKIIGKTSMSLFSWGEKITISKFNNKIKIESKTLFRVLLLNNKKNKKNILRLKEIIES